jgi:hypothetical protein
VTPKTQEASPAWAPEFLDMAGVAHLLSTSQKQVQRLLSAGRLPDPDLNISGTGGPKGKRWRRERLVAWLDARRP